MSRTTTHNSFYDLAYGFDHAVGWFVQVFTRSQFRSNENHIVEALEGITPKQIVEVASKYGFTIETPDERVNYN